MEQTINIKLKIWRQRGPKEPGQFVDYSLDNVPTNISFLEMLDMLNEQLVEKGEEPVVFDNDCREGICGMCSLYINGNPHGPVGSITTCQLHMRKFNDGDTITIEPWRSHAFPVIRRPLGLRQNPAGWWLRIVQYGRSRRCQRNTYLKGGSRRGNGLSYLHRLRCLRGSLQERFCHVVRLFQGEPVGFVAAGSSRGRTPCQGHDCQDGRTGLR